MDSPGGGEGGRPSAKIGGWALGTLGTLAAFAVYLRLARTRAVNSDGASIALQAWDMLHGNPLLRGWRLADVTFYTTEVPQYALVELVRGLGPDVVHVATAMTYTLVVLFAALLAKGTASGREAAVRVALAAGILLAPEPLYGVNVLLSSPDHIGTSVPVMAVWLIVDRARPRWYVPVVTSALLAWALAGDTLVAIIGVVPLLLVCAIRVLRSLLARSRPPSLRRWLAAQWYEIALAAGAVAAAVAGEAVPRLIHADGGYTGQPPGTSFAPLGEILGHNLVVTGQSLLLLAGADFIGLRPGASTPFVVLHLAGVALAACGIAVAAWRFARDGDQVNQLLLAAIAANLLAFVTGTHVLNLPSAREIAPVLPRARTTWLEQHRLGTGLSGYWEANVVALTSGDRVAVHLVGDDCTCGRITVGSIEVKASWFDPARSAADFLVLFPGISGYPGFTGRQQALATFGKPARTYHVGGFTILYWHKNLLAELHP